MSKTVLIIDDQEQAAEAVADACRGLGLNAVTITNPAEAKAAFERQPPDLVVIDLFLPGTDGYTVGRQIRSTPTGATVPIIAVSGVLKQSTVPREVWTKLKGDFLPKPFDVPALQSLVSLRLGLATEQPKSKEDRPRAPKRAIPEAKSFDSDLRRDPVYRIYARLYEQRASGHLELVRGKARRRVTFFQGRLRFATSNLKQENVGGMQVARGEIEQEEFEKAIETARARRLTVSEALISNQAMTRAQVDKALAEQVRAIATGALAWADGRARFELDSDGAANVPDHVVHPLEMVVHGIAKHYPPSSIKSFLQGRREGYVHRTELLEREKFILRKSSPGEQITIAITGQTRLGELLDKAREQDLPLIFALVGTGLVTLDKAPQGATPAAAPLESALAGHAAAAPSSAQASSLASSTRPSTPASAAKADGNGSPPASEKDLSARAEIEAEHNRIAGATHYEVLGVAPSGDAEAVLNAYRRAASKWHIDRFGGCSLGPTGKLLEEVFARIGEAKDVLSSDDRRQEYDVYLDRKAKGLPTDVEAILRAEGCFQDGEKLMKAGKAALALDKFEAAISMNDSEPEFYAWRGYARFRLEGESARKQALDDIQRSLKADSNMPGPNYLLGMMALHAEDLAEARRLFKRVLIQNPEHPEAKQQLRLIKTRMDKKGGLLGKLFKK